MTLQNLKTAKYFLLPFLVTAGAVLLILVAIIAMWDYFAFRRRVSRASTSAYSWERFHHSASFLNGIYARIKTADNILAKQEMVLLFILSECAKHPNSLGLLETLPRASELSRCGGFGLRRIRALYELLARSDPQHEFWKKHFEIVCQKLAG